MDVKLILYGGNIENAYMSRFLKLTHAAVLSIHDNRHTYDSYVCLLCPINHPYYGDGNIAIPTVIFFWGGMHLPSAIVDAYVQKGRKKNQAHLWRPCLTPKEESSDKEYG